MTTSRPTSRRRRGMLLRPLAACAVAALAMPIVLAMGVQPAAASQNDRSDWDVSALYPSCLSNGQYPIDYVTCLPDNTEPTATTSLVYGQLIYSNGDPVQLYQGQGAGGLADLAINGDDPYADDEDNPVNVQTPAWDGYFAFIQTETPGSMDNVESLTPAGEDEPWIFDDSYDGFDTPFGGPDFTHPSAETEWRSDAIDGEDLDPVPVDYGTSTDLGTIVLPSPPAINASCTADLEAPAGSVNCSAEDTNAGAIGATGEGTDFSWGFPTSGDDLDDYYASGADASFTFPQGDGDYPVSLFADDGGDWSTNEAIDANTFPCGSTCISTNTSFDAPVSADDGNQHAVQNYDYTINETVTNEGDTTMEDVTPGAIGGSPNVVTDGPQPATIDALEPGQSASFSWLAHFTQIDGPDTSSSFTIPVTATEGERTDSAPGDEVDFLTDASGIQVGVQGPASTPSVGSLVPFQVAVTNNSGHELTDVGPTNATLLLTQLTQQGNSDDGTIDFSTSAQNPTPIPPPVATLADGATADFVVKGVATVAGTDTVDVSATATNPDDSTDTSAGTTDVTVAEQQPQPAPGFTLSTSPANPVVGQPFTVSAQLTNTSTDETDTEFLNVANVGNAQVFPTTTLTSQGFSGASGLSLSPGTSISVQLYSGTATAAGTYHAVGYLTSQYATDTNTTAQTASTTFTVGPANPLQPQSISFNDPLSTVTYGVDAPQTVRPTASSGLAVTVTSATPSVCSVTGAGTFTITALSGGQCVLSARQPGDTVTWGAAASVSRSFTINREPQTINFPTIAEVTLPASATASATTSLGLPVTFSSLTQSVCGVEPGGGIIFSYYGTCTVEANQAGSATALPAPPVTQSFTVLPSPDAQSQTITFAQPTDMTFGDEPQKLDPTAPGGAVQLSSGASAACSVNGSEISLHASGTCTITATQPGDGLSWLAAVPVTYSINVAPAQLTITGMTFFAHAGDTFDNWPVSVSGLVYTDGAGKVGGSESCTGPFTSVSYVNTITGAPGAYPTTCTGFSSVGYHVNYAPGTITILPAGTPEPPTAVSALTGVDQASVSWTAPNDAVGTYTATASPGGATCTATTPSGCTVAGLTPGTEYTFSVTSTTAGVTGPSSAASNPVLVTSAGPNESLLQGASGGDETTSTVSISTSGQYVYAGLNLGGAPGKGSLVLAPYAADPVGGFGTNGDFFDVHLSTGAQYDDLELYFCGPATPGLTPEWWDPNAQAYEQLSPTPTTAPSELDNSACSVYTLTSTTTPSLQQLEGSVFGLVNPAPTAPSSVGVTGPSTVAAGSSYSATARALGANPRATYALAAGAPSWLSVDPTTGAVTGTVPSSGVTSFAYAVTATNSKGSVSSPTQTVTVTTTVKVPGAPSGAKAVPGVGQATVSWTAPASNGGSAITGYTVTSAPGAKTCTTAATTCVVTGLTNGQSYTFTVTAKNVAGAGAASTATTSVTPGQADKATIKLSTSKLTYGDEQVEKISVGVAATSGTTKPTGTVTVSSLSGTVCTVTLKSGAGSCTLASTHLAAGTYAVAAVYAGSSVFSSASSATATLTVAKASTTSVLKLSASKVAKGKEGSEKLSVTVTPQFAGASVTGKVTISTGSGAVCTITLSKGKGSCTLSSSQLKAGTYAVVASYAGTADLKTSTSKKVTLTVT